MMGELLSCLKSRVPLSVLSRNLQSPCHESSERNKTIFLFIGGRKQEKGGAVVKSRVTRPLGFQLQLCGTRLSRGRPLRARTSGYLLYSCPCKGELRQLVKRDWRIVSGKQRFRGTSYNINVVAISGVIRWHRIFVLHY